MPAPVMTPLHGGGGGVADGTVGAFVNTLSRHNYIYVQPTYHVATAGDLQGASTAATGSLTDLFGRVAALPPNSPGAVPPASTVQPLTMFRIVGGGGGGGTQPQQIVAYRHRPTAVNLHPPQPVLLPASAVRPTPAAALFAPRQQVIAHCNSVGGADATRRVEAEAHELTSDSAGRELHRCRLCARVFSVLAAFRAHLLSAHCRPRNQCAVCGKQFSRSWLLKGHMRTHTGERPYHCPHCERAFADKSNLRSHLLIHSATGKHYVCTRCNRAFAQKRYLHKHRLEVCKL